MKYDYPIALSLKARQMVDAERRKAREENRTKTGELTDPRPPIKVRIARNETQWSTLGLRRALTRILRSTGLRARAYGVRVCYNRNDGHYSSGEAYLHSSEFTIRVRRPKHDTDMLDADDLLDFACVAIHEVEHCLGLRHPEMIDGCGRDKVTRNVRLSTDSRLWVSNLDIRARPAKAKPLVTLAPAAPPPTANEILAARRARAEATRLRKLDASRDKLVTWERRLRLAKTKVKRYTAEVRRRERVDRIAASRPARPENPESTE